MEEQPRVSRITQQGAKCCLLRDISVICMYHSSIYTQRHRHTRKDTHVHAHTQGHTHAQTQTHAHAHTDTHRHTHTSKQSTSVKVCFLTKFLSGNQTSQGVDGKVNTVEELGCVCVCVCV